jgi:hypothetical protein
MAPTAPAMPGHPGAAWRPHQDSGALPGRPRRSAEHLRSGRSRGAVPRRAYPRTPERPPSPASVRDPRRRGASNELRFLPSTNMSGGAARSGRGGARPPRSCRRHHQRQPTSAPSRTDRPVFHGSTRRQCRKAETPPALPAITEGSRSAASRPRPHRRRSRSANLAGPPPRVDPALRLASAMPAAFRAAVSRQARRGRPSGRLRRQSLPDRRTMRFRASRPGQRPASEAGARSAGGRDKDRAGEAGSARSTQAVTELPSGSTRCPTARIPAVNLSGQVG